MTHRRQFIALTTAAAATPWLTTSLLAQTPHDSAQHPIIIFAKPLQHLDFEQLGKRLQSIGVQGIEATLRGDGQVAPQNFERELPKLTESLAKYEQRVVIAACEINQANSESQQQLELFARLGIPNIRMQYYRYDYSKPLLPQLDIFAKQAAELAQLCKSVKVKALYQNHAGKNYVGAALWDLQQVLREIDPQWLGVALDIRHTALELSQSWPSGYAVIRPHVGAVYVKDVSWINNKPENVPLGTGITQPLFEAVKRDGLIGPLSLHVEYIDHREAALQEQRWAAVAQDVAMLRTWLS
jgi:sugar phosphate isomerase/epimerase